ncbi:tryptophan synthase subunit alpha [Alkalicoccus urumqiensis]|uniref:Tryptophan synthase alpha chain n=1 Tax=Alkalicoccus urumqiensis TaxID=1548213 RepID=A0A2P6MKJ3_ALKUR|nr:tryptophan synthase subunit alpha [Alkalicoccus urumqiensis]PRO66819.1 tryptophan synthase subunit alpha [Alkalicoccus urumqiensis]
MNRLVKDEFQQKQNLFVPYMMSSFPSFDASVDIALRLEKAGVDAIEWGVPFSDPLADGPVIQNAGDHARSQGGSLREAVRGAKLAREKGLTVPLVLFTYVNPVLSVGWKETLDLMKDADMDAILIPDLPHEESEELRNFCREYGISLIALVAPSSRSRMEAISRLGDGFIYYVTSLGVTGTRDTFAEGIEESVNALKKHADVPVLAGFGISKPEHVAEFQKYADGVIVGSALVKFIGDRKEALVSGNPDDALNEIQSFVEALMAKDGVES